MSYKEMQQFINECYWWLLSCHQGTAGSQVIRPGGSIVERVFLFPNHMRKPQQVPALTGVLPAAEIKAGGERDEV